jgi:hypothetical protein
VFAQRVGRPEQGSRRGAGARPAPAVRDTARPIGNQAALRLAARGAMDERLPPALDERVPDSVQAVLQSPGAALDPTAVEALAPLFGADVSAVRIHAGADAARSTRDVRADAYTVGRHVVFGAARYAPGTAAGQRLLAHELAHLAQQRQTGVIRLQRQPAEHGLPFHIMIADATRLNPQIRWHYDTMPAKLKTQLTKQIQDAFAFLPNTFPVTVAWGQFKPAELKIAGNIQVWLVPDSAPDLADPILKAYGYKKEAIKAAVDDLGNVRENTFDDDSQRRYTIGLTPTDTADQANDPMTARPVIVKVPAEFTEELTPPDGFAKAHPTATASRRIGQIGDTILHEVGHDLNIAHAAGNIGATSKSGGHEQSFPPDIMDEVTPVMKGHYADAANIELTKAEVESLGGAEKLRQSAVVQKVEIDQATKDAQVWIDPLKLKYSTDEQDVITRNLKNMVLFVDSRKAVKPDKTP